MAGQYLSIAAPMTPLSELITDMGLYDAAMQGLRAERREQVVSGGRGRERCASMQGVVEEVGRDAEVQRVSHAAADPFSARGNARATPHSLEARRRPRLAARSVAEQRLYAAATVAATVVKN